MKVENTKLTGVLLITPKVYEDDRGFFMESYQQQKFTDHGMDIVFKQDNHSRSKRGTLRGLHYQYSKSAQTKLVRCLLGEIYDVVIDLRRASSTFGHWEGFFLSAENKKQLFVPQGFAHGFLVLSDFAEVLYKCDNYYQPFSERGIIWNDPDLAIDWQIKSPIVSDKDKKLPLLRDILPQDLF